MPKKTGGKVGGSSGLASLQAGGQIPDPEDDPDEFTKEEEAALAAVLAEAQPGFLETVGDTVSSGISSIGDFLMERPKENLLSGPTRLQNISDFLIGYSQADPSKPLGTQFGQAAASMSAKQAKQRQQRLENILAKQLLGVKARTAGIKAAKALDIPISTANSLRDALLKVDTERMEDREKDIVIRTAEDAIKGKQGRNVELIKIMLNRFKTPAGEGDPSKKGNSGKVTVVPPSPEQTIMSKQKAAYGT